MNRHLQILAACFAFLSLGVHALLASAPEVSDVRVSQRDGTKLVDIHYDVSYPPGGTLTTWVHVSGDGGRSYIVPAKTFSGDIGSGVAPGNDRHIVWDAEADYDGIRVEEARVRVTAHAGTVPISPEGMELIPGGNFQMGDADEPNGTRVVYVSPFFLDRYEVTGQLWGSVREWAYENGYSGIDSGGWRELDHPVQDIDWYSAVKWLNARSEMEGLTPVYYTDESRTSVYRSGDIDLTNAMVRWDADGYRLPTEAEWEKAARGGLHGKEYPWGDEIDGGMANYSGSNHPFQGGSPDTTPVGYYNGDQTPSGPDMANGYGLYDMAGNVREWCWDWYESTPTGTTNPKGPESAQPSRVPRGGSWNHSADDLRVSRRNNLNPGYDYYYGGFRCARGL